MSSRLLAAGLQEVKFQVRHGLYFVYLIVSMFYIVGLRFLPDGARATVVTILVFTDTSVLGFLFVGGMLLLERGQRTHEYLFITPLRIREYIFAKVASLTLLALAASLSIVFLAGAVPSHPVPMLFAVILSSALFTLGGFITALMVRTINFFIIISIPLAAPLMVPLLRFLGLGDSWFLYLLPTQGSLLLLSGGYEGLSLGHFLYGIAVMVAWIVPLWLVAEKVYTTRVVEGIGEN